MTQKTIVLGITGASGSAYAVRLAQVLLMADCDLHVVASDAARQVAMKELGTAFPDDHAQSGDWVRFLNTAFDHVPASQWGFPETRLSGRVGLAAHSFRNYAAGIASGSFLTTGMVVCPCSMGTVSSIACGMSTNLIQRAADVHLKERRPLILVPRETPLGLIGLQNMTTLTAAGATVLPAMPGFYQNPASIADLVNFVVARICDHLNVTHDLIPRWGD
ncbi:MAG: flavin prenyltransferase UbiX [Planctomycetaceae bacterium]